MRYLQVHGLLLWGIACIGYAQSQVEGRQLRAAIEKSAIVEPEPTAEPAYQTGTASPEHPLAPALHKEASPSPLHPQNTAQPAAHSSRNPEQNASIQLKPALEKVPKPE